MSFSPFSPLACPRPSIHVLLPLGPRAVSCSPLGWPEGLAPLWPGLRASGHVFLPLALGPQAVSCSPFGLGLCLAPLWADLRASDLGPVVLFCSPLAWAEPFSPRLAPPWASWHALLPLGMVCIYRAITALKKIFCMYVCIGLSLPNIQNKLQ